VALLEVIRFHVFELCFGRELWLRRDLCYVLVASYVLLAFRWWWNAKRPDRVSPAGPLFVNFPAFPRLPWLRLVVFQIQPASVSQALVR